jgi:hypothetical protein
MPVEAVEARVSRAHGILPAPVHARVLKKRDGTGGIEGVSMLSEFELK